MEMTGEMGSVEIASLEKIARQMITDKLRMERVEGKHGTIYLAHGVNAEGTIVGLWGSRGGAHDFEFHDGTTADTVRQFLMNHAQGTVKAFVDRDIIDA